MKKKNSHQAQQHEKKEKTLHQNMTEPIETLDGKQTKNG